MSNVFRWFLLGALCLMGIAVFYPTICYLPDRTHRWPCQSNLKQILVALRQYDADYDSRLPSLDTPAGWRDALSPYARDAAVFQCPGDRDTSPQTADYFFNARLSGAREDSLANEAITVVFGEGYPTTDPRVALTAMPKSWLADPKSPVHRHLDGSNYAFLDGHVKWLRPEKISTQSPSEGGVTFAVR